MKIDQTSSGYNRTYFPRNQYTLELIFLEMRQFLENAVACPANLPLPKAFAESSKPIYVLHRSQLLGASKSTKVKIRGPKPPLLPTIWFTASLQLEIIPVFLQIQLLQSKFC